MGQDAKTAKYYKELAGAMVLYAVVLVVALTVGKGMAPGLAQTALFVSPMIPFMLAVWAVVRQIRRSDEFIRKTTLEHIAIASTIDLLLIAPATANIIGKLANGIADDFLSTLYIATRAPVLVAPAMNTQMFAHEAVRRNLDTLAARGVRFVEPGEGYLACGWIGKGRLAEPAEIVEAAETILRPPGPLRGRRVLVTAGPTYEDVDPVRYLGNRSSGTKAKKPKSSGNKVAAKYRNASTGESWSGRGLQPRWLKAALASGRKLTDFAV